MSKLKNSESDNINVCFAASSGGHLEQLMMLKPLMNKYNSMILTEQTPYTLKIDNIPVVYLKQVNRKEKLFVFTMLMNLFMSLKFYIKQQPDVVISTGVLAVIPICIIAKLFKRKIVYIESFAKVNTPTETGRLMYKIADQFYVQWESMLSIFPKAIYCGGIY